jgi:GAF domain-containing protein
VVGDDRQVLAGLTDAAEGVDRNASLEDSICKYAVASGEPLIIDDATKHPMLADHPKVVDGTVRSYAGILLADSDGNAIGTLCTWDGRPRRWTSGQIQILKDLAEVARSKVFIDLPTESGWTPPPARPTRRWRRS